MVAGTEEIVQGFDAIAGHDDFVCDAVLVKRPQRERFIVRIVFNQQYRAFACHKNSLF